MISQHCGVPRMGNNCRGTVDDDAPRKDMSPTSRKTTRSKSTPVSPARAQSPPPPPTRVISEGKPRRVPQLLRVLTDQEEQMERELHVAMPPIHTMVKAGFKMKKMLFSARQRLQSRHEEAAAAEAEAEAPAAAADEESDQDVSTASVKRNTHAASKFAMNKQREEQIKAGIRLLEQVLVLMPDRPS